MTIAGARSLSRAEALNLLERNLVLGHPASVAQRREMLALVIGGPLGPAERTRCEELLKEAMRTQNYLLCPGTIEDIWWLEGILDRLSLEDGG